MGVGVKQKGGGEMGIFFNLVKNVYIGPNAELIDDLCIVVV